MNESTVVSEYIPEREANCVREESTYQTEGDLERNFIKRLQGQGYEYLRIHEEADLISNLRHQLELLNGYTFSDDEWKRFFAENIASANDGIVEKTRRIQNDPVQTLKRDDGSSKNITLIDKKNIHNMSISVDIPLLGYKNISLSVTAEGYLTTNILDTGKAFFIGTDKVNDFMQYLGVGAIFPTGTKTDAAAVSMNELRSIRQSVNLPIVAIGGISKENAGLFHGMGIDGLAVVSAVIAQPDIRLAASELKRLFVEGVSL